MNGYTSIVVGVTAARDAHIALGQGVENNDKHWEIVIGGWSDTKSVIRDRKQGRHLVTSHVKDLLSDKEQRPFWVSWADDYIRVGQGTQVGKRELMKTRKSSAEYSIPINSLYVAGYSGSKGDWKLYCPEGKTQCVDS